jgi:uncharacterized protein
VTFDEAIGALVDDADLPTSAMAVLLDDWAELGARCRGLLESYVAGRDLSERTERALFYVVHLLGEKADTGSYRPLCKLLHDRERADLIFGDEWLCTSAPAILISVFDGDRAPLAGLVADPGVDDTLRGEVLMVLAYLARTGRIPEGEFYAYLAALPSELASNGPEYHWYAWACAVGGLGFGGLSLQAETMFRDGRIGANMMIPADFWADLRDAREDPGGTGASVWHGIGPLGSAISFLLGSEAADGEMAWDQPSPVRNPLRDVGRNDPCPCGSGRKYKKCCLATAGSASVD